MAAQIHQAVRIDLHRHRVCILEADSLGKIVMEIFSKFVELLLAQVNHPVSFFFVISHKVLVSILFQPLKSPREVVLFAQLPQKRNPFVVAFSHEVKVWIYVSQVLVRFCVHSLVHLAVSHFGEFEPLNWSVLGANLGDVLGDKSKTKRVIVRLCLIEGLSSSGFFEVYLSWKASTRPEFVT